MWNKFFTILNFFCCVNLFVEPVVSFLLARYVVERRWLKKNQSQSKYCISNSSGTKMVCKKTFVPIHGKTNKQTKWLCKKSYH